MTDKNKESSEVFWLNDPSVLYANPSLQKFVPSFDKQSTTQLNALTRLYILIFVILLIYSLFSGTANDSLSVVVIAIIFIIIGYVFIIGEDSKSEYFRDMIGLKIENFIDNEEHEKMSSCINNTKCNHMPRLKKEKEDKKEKKKDEKDIEYTMKKVFKDIMREDVEEKKKQKLKEEEEEYKFRESVGLTEESHIIPFDNGNKKCVDDDNGFIRTKPLPYNADDEDIDNKQDVFEIIECNQDDIYNRRFFDWQINKEAHDLPDDRDTLARWLNKDPYICKTNPYNCVRYQDLRDPYKML